MGSKQIWSWIWTRNVHVVLKSDHLQYNTRLFAWLMGQTTRQPSVWRSKYFFFIYFFINNTWDIRRLVNESFVPSAQQTRVLYFKLTDFKSIFHSLLSFVYIWNHGSDIQKIEMHLQKSFAFTVQNLDPSTTVLAVVVGVQSQ